MRTSHQHASSGIAGLDEVMCGGFPAGNLYLINGASGVGKTTLGLQFLIAGARQGENVLYIGTSENEREIRKVAQSHDWSMDEVAVHHHAAPDLGQEQTMLHPADIELPQTMDMMLSLVERHNPSRLVIDSLAEIRVLARDEHWYRRQLMTLKQHFADKDCTVLLIEIPHEQRQTLNSVVSGVLELSQNTPLYGPDRRRLRVAKIRGQDFATGYHDYKIRKGGLEVFPRLTAAEHRRRFERELFSTGLDELDEGLHGGLTRGTSTLLLGASGTGKSVFATQLATAAAARGERVLVYVFDERVQTLFQRSEGIGLPLARHVEEGTIQVVQIDPAELTSGEFSDQVKTAVQQDGIRMLVIDSLNGYAYAMPEERLLDVYLHELSSYLSQQGVSSVFTMAQHGLAGCVRDQPFDLSYIADTVILFGHRDLDGHNRKTVSIYKCRSGPHDTSIRELQITTNGVRIGKPLHQLRGAVGEPPALDGKLG